MLKKKKLLILMTALTMSGGLVSVNTSTYAAGEYSGIKSPHFKPEYVPKDKAKALEYSKEHFTEWKKTLQRSHQEILDKIKVSSNEINKELKEIYGDISKIADMKFKKQIVDMDKMIKQRVNQITKKQTIYTYFTAQDLGYENESKMMQDNNKLQFDEKKIDNIVTKFTYGNFTDLRIGNLMLFKGKSEERYVVQLELPKGTYLGHLGDGQTILPLDYAMKIETDLIGQPKTSIITIDGKQLIKVKAKLVGKDEIKKEVNKKEIALNGELKKKFGEEIKKDSIIKLNFKGMFPSYSVKTVEKAINDLINNVPSRILKDTIRELESITFTDEKLIGEEGTTGFYSNSEIYLKTNHKGFFKQLEGVDLSRAFIHEMGHAIDDILFSKTSLSPKFEQIYEREKGNLTSLVTHINSETNERYATTNSEEFFAEIFKAIYSPDSKQREAVKKEAPDAVEYIKNKIEEYIKISKENKS
ncbi:lethal factor domain protein [Bacillus cereus]|nr:lethal factor domain protein [Bacillus cereus]